MRKGCQVILLVKLNMGGVSDACFGPVCFPLLLSRYLSIQVYEEMLLKSQQDFGTFCNCNPSGQARSRDLNYGVGRREDS